MEINLKKAVKQFFPNPSLDMIYFEAVANAIDAGATEISIAIQIESFLKQETLLIKIEDNGKGFTDENFARFSKLMETEEENHKGLGRLVYLNYFKSVDVISYYENKKRTFVFDDIFHGESQVEDSAETKQNTCLSFNAYLLAKIKTYDYINPPRIKESLKLHFYPQFHSFKINNRALKLSIRVDTNEIDETHDFYNRQCQLNVAELPDLEENTFKVKGLNLFDGEMTLRSSIQKIERKSEIITAVCVENRTIPWEIIRPTDLPDGYEALFLLYSDYFDGKVNFARNKLDLEPHEKDLVEEEFIKAVSDILIEKIPSLVEKNRTVKKDLTDRYPHLQGYFNSKAVGLLSRESTLETAQKQFFKEQKGILEANSLDDEQFQKSMEISSRLLTEYVLYRNLIIRKLKEITVNNTEADIHEIIVPMKKTFRNKRFIEDIYNNNAWLLDDKYISYTTILSDEKMSNLLREISLDGENIEDEKTRPDIALVFSGDPLSNGSAKVDVVIVELKKRGASLMKNEEVTSQLRQRARKLLDYFPHKIQRIWFYGIVDIDEEFLRSLKELEYLEVFSSGKVFYKELKVIPYSAPDTKTPIYVYILSFDAFLKDAETRNSAFLRILKEGLKRGTEKN